MNTTLHAPTEAPSSDVPERRWLVVLGALAALAAVVLLWSMVSVLHGQMARAEQRQALIKAQHQEVARCWQQGASALLVRACVAEVRWRTAQALDASYGLEGRVRPAGVSDVSMVSLR
jgi:hypothetical protein